MKRLSIRWQLTLWYGVVLAAVLLVFSTGVYFVLRHHMLQGIDEGLSEELSDVLAEIRRTDNDENLTAMLHHRFASHEDFDFQVTRPDGSRVFASDRLGNTGLPVPESPVPSNAPILNTVLLPTGEQWRSLSYSARDRRKP